MQSSALILIMLLFEIFNSSDGLLMKKILSRSKNDMFPSPTIQHVIEKQTEESVSGMKGFYRRPSRAIEKGGGFFVPGLEGEKIRLTTVAVIIIMFAINRYGNDGQFSLNLFVSEAIGTSMALVLFIQSVISIYGGDSSSDAGRYLSVVQSSDNSKISDIDFIARTVVRTSDNIKRILVLSDGVIQFELALLGSPPTSSSQATLIHQATIKSSSSAALTNDRKDAPHLEELLASKSVKYFLDIAGRLWVFGCESEGWDAQTYDGWIRSLLDSPLLERES